jgi:hypothetical protein|eukprot:SAG25_NODE_563_length_6908_cov_10.085035_7_plen_124_part_00
MVIESCPCLSPLLRSPLTAATPCCVADGTRTGTASSDLRVSCGPSAYLLRVIVKHATVLRNVYGNSQSSQDSDSGRTTYDAEMVLHACGAPAAAAALLLPTALVGFLALLPRGSGTRCYRAEG